ncbi:hypothetical protein EES44_01805 [Streptomyces sp. ADI96-15]|nr:hypothetical protein EES44_01805 [Streptomyces sp. ADI96-15]
MLRTESPPSSKKSSSTPTSSTSSVRAQTEAISFSVAVRGATRSSPAVPAAEAASARRSTLPLGVRGRASVTAKRAGTR